MKLYTTIFCLFSFCIAFSQPAHLRFQTYGASNGLSQSVVQKIHQGSDGFLWIATQDGLNRFDGVNFKIYKKEAAPYGLPWNNIRDITEDKATKLLWIATPARGICALNPASQQVLPLVTDNNVSLISDVCNSLSLSEKQVWVATAKGISVVDKSTRRITRNIDLDKKHIQKVLLPDVGSVWAFSKDGWLYVLQEQTGRLLQRFSPKELFQKDTIELENASVFGDGVYMTTRQGLYHSPLQNVLPAAPFTKIPVLTNKGENLTDKYIYSFFIDSKKNTWIGVDVTGLLLKRQGDAAFQVWQKNIADPHSLPDNFIRQTFEDRSGTIWLATEKGLARLIPQPSFLHTTGQEVDKSADRLSRLFAIATVDDDRNLLIGRISELWLYDSYVDSIAPVQNTWGLDPQRFYFIEPSGNNTFFAGCKNGLGIVEKKGNHYIFRKPEEYPELTAAAYRLTTIAAVDGENYLLGGIGDAGLFLWNKKSHTLTRFVHSDDNRSLVSNNITRIIPSASGYFWISTEKGLSRFHLQTRTFTNYTFKDKNGSEVPFINDLKEEGPFLWMVFYGQGLARWNRQTGELLLFGAKNGLASDMVYNMRADKTGNFWISTNAGLVLFLKNTRQFIHYKTEDGVQDNEFNRFCVYESERYLYFGGISGLTRIQKSTGSLYRPHPPVAITGVKYLHESQYVEYKNLNAGTISLQHRQNDMMLQYAALDFSVNHRTQYAYRLKGYDNRWINNGSATEVTYTNLAPGHYVFEVKATNPEFNGESKIASLPIYIIPAWYQTTLFKIAVILAILGALFYLIQLYYQARLRRQRIEYEKLLAVQTERQRISSEIHDDIGAGLSGVRLLTELTRRKAESPELRQDVDKIYGSVSELSGKMREVIWSLNTENDTLESLLLYLRRQAYQLFESSPIKLSFSLPDSIPDTMLTGEKRRHIFLAVKEALHNALKHSEATNVQVTATVNSSTLKIAVSDDGKGLPASEDNTGNGLRNMQQRMQQVSGQMALQNEQGTEIVFTIPLK